MKSTEFMMNITLIEQLNVCIGNALYLFLDIPEVDNAFNEKISVSKAVTAWSMPNLHVVASTRMWSGCQPLDSS